MIKIYREKTFIQAEQFDGSDCMRKSRNIGRVTFNLGDDNEESSYIMQNYGTQTIKIGDWIVTDAAGNKYICSDEEFKLRYEEVME